VHTVTADTLIRIIALCIVLAGAETLHGIARIKLIIPRIGKERAVKLSALTGTVLAFAICWALVPGIGFRSAQAHFVLGLALAAFMAAFDVAIGRWLMRKSWAKIWPDFDPRSGNYLLFGLLGLSIGPLLVWLALGS
jgi:hypothetical protein